MKIKLGKILLIGFLFSSILLATILIFKPALAMAPPPASHIWLWLLNGNNPPTGGAGKLVTVTVTWPEGTRTETVTLKTLLKDVRN